MGWLDGSVFIYLFIHWISGKLLLWTPRRGEGGEGGEGLLKSMASPRRLELGSGA